MTEDEPASEPPAEDTDGDNITTNTRARWEYMGTVATGLVYLATLGVWAYGTINAGVELPGNLGPTVVTVFLLHALWVVGPQAVDAYKKLKG